MANFNDLLTKIHNKATASTSIISDANDVIVINVDRSFTIPEEFNKTIAFEGDVNSQIVTFTCNKIAEGHNLFDCQEKRLRWKNIASEREGSSKLISREEENTLVLEWQAPPEAFTKAGQLEISISIFDFLDKQIAYSWNTAVLKELSVGESLTSVGYKIGYNDQNHEDFDYIPAKNEILSINSETRKIIAPQKYNNVFCNYGDIDTSVVYFQINRYIRGIDVLDENVRFRMYWKLDKLANTEDSSTTKNLYAVALEGRDSEGLVNIIWKPSRAITNNSLFYCGEITIQLEIQSSDKVWRTAPYTNLAIGKSEFSEFVTDLPAEEGNVNAYVIDGALTTQDKIVNTVSGLVKLRSFTKSDPIFVNKNELVIENDENGNYVGVKIGLINNQDARTAPYVAYTPSTIIVVDGGDAFGD